MSSHPSDAAAPGTSPESPTEPVSEPAAKVLVEIRDVAKAYQRDSQRIDVFEHVTLNIQEGEFLALMGPSGSGKTTLLNILAGLDRPDTGSVVVDGREITTMSNKQLAAWRSTHIGFIFQFYNLLPVLTAYQNVELPLLLTNLSKKQRRDHVMTALELVTLTDRAEHFPGQLSGGQQQRVGIARAVVSDPTIILGDEPTGDLDAKSADEILTLLGRLNTEFNKTILIVTHDAHAADRAHEVMHLDKGVLHR
jgi:putative ABC transport system ATP-binding protein